MAVYTAYRVEFVNVVPEPPTPETGPELGVWGYGVWGFRFIWKSFHKGPTWKNGLWASS